MYNRLTILVTALALTATTTAFAQTTVDTTGRVVRVDPGAQVIILDNNQALRVTPSTVLLVDNQPVALGALQPGQAVVIRSGQAVTLAPAGSAQAPGSTVVIAPATGARTTGQQTIYGRISDVDRGEIKVETDGGDFEVKMPPEVAAQLRKGDNVRLDLTFLR